MLTHITLYIMYGSFNVDLTHFHGFLQQDNSVVVAKMCPKKKQRVIYTRSNNTSRKCPSYVFSLCRPKI